MLILRLRRGIATNDTDPESQKDSRVRGMDDEGAGEIQKGAREEWRRNGNP